VKTGVAPVLKTAATFVYQVPAVDAGLDTQAEAANFTIELKNFKDDSVRTNAGATFETTVSSVDIVKPQVTSGILTKKGTATDADDNEFTVDGNGSTITDVGLAETTKAQVTLYFTEAMDADTIVYLSNYLITIAGTELPGTSISGLTAAAASDAKSVVLSFTGTVATDKTTYTAGIDHLDEIKVLLVKDIAGNTIATTATGSNYAFNEAVNIANGPDTLVPTAIGGTAAYQAQTYALVAKNQIKIGFNNAISTISPSDFTIYDTVDTKTVLVGVDYSLDSTNKVVTITFNGNLNEDGTYGASDHAVRIDIAKSNLKDIYGNTMATPATPITQAWSADYDFIAPTLKDVTIVADTGAGHDTVELIFNEDIAVTSAAGLKSDIRLVVQASTPYELELADYAGVTNFAVSNNIITFNIDKAIDNKVTVELLNGRYITDASTAANKTTAFAATTVRNAADTADYVIDTTAVTATLPATTGSTNTTLALVATYDEALYVSGTAAETGDDLKALYNVTTGSITSAIYNADNYTVTFVLVGTIDNDQITLAGATITDKEGNVIDTANDVFDYDHGTTLFTAQ
jgi:hypothetical protein